MKSFEKTKEISLVNSASLCFVLVTTYFMKSPNLSDDQITYLSTAKRTLGMIPGMVYWDPVDFFSYVLAGVYKITGDFAQSFVWIYFFIAMLYLNAMYWSLGFFFKDKKVRCLVSLISLVPHYTFGMTYWGFAGFEYIKARILFMPVAPVVLRLFFEWKEDKKIRWVFFLCALSGILSYEAFYLLAALILYSVVRIFRLKEDKAGIKRNYISGVLVSVAMVCLIHFSGYIHVILNITSPVEEVYHQIILKNESILSAFSKMEAISFYWKAAYDGFWWAMFPPKYSDIVFVSFSSFFLILFGIWGAVLQKKEDPRSFRANIYFMGAVVFTAYFYQAVRFLGWKFFNQPPHILEEVRAIKFIYFPLFLFTSFYLVGQIKRKNFLFLFISVCLLLVSPLEVLRALPQRQKQFIYHLGAKVLKDPKYNDYLSKALKIRSLEAERDLEHIAGLLRTIHDREGKIVSVLSDRHELQLSGQNVFISYQDKRWYDCAIGEKKYNALIYWNTAFSEISEALRSRDSGRILKAADKYECGYAVLDFKPDDPRLGLLYAGKAYCFYKIKK